MPSKGEVRVKAGQTLVFETPGGGSYGPPKDRKRSAIEDDLVAELISPTATSDDYGFEP